MQQTSPKNLCKTNLAPGYWRLMAQKAGVACLACLLGWGAYAQELAIASKPQAEDSAIQDQGKKSLRSFLDKFSTQYAIKFAFDSKLVEDKIVQLSEDIFTQENYSAEEIERTLEQILRPFDLQYVKVYDNYYVIQAKDEATEGKVLKMIKKAPDFSSVGTSASAGAFTKLSGKGVSSLGLGVLERKIIGKVTDENNEGLPGVNIIIKGTTKGTVTDLDGNYALAVPDEEVILVFSSIGFESQEITAGSQNVINIAMVPDVRALDEIVVIGYGEQTKESVVGSIVQTTGEVLKQSGGVSTVGQALTGRLPGVITVSTTGMPGEESPEIYIRGQGTWNGGGQPLILVDGIERGMNDININDIEKLSVLKDASATAVFGVKGANGVILITTKRGQKGKTQLSLSASSAVKTPSKIPQKLRAYRALGVVNDAIVSELPAIEESWADYNPIGVMEKYRNPANQYERERYPDVDWADVVMKDAALDYNVDLSARGGTDFAQYFGSLSYQHVGDIFDAGNYDNGRSYTPDFSYNRFNYRSNVDFNITNTTKVSVNLSGFYGIQNSIGTGDMRLVYSSLYGLAPTLFYPMHEDGTYGIDPSGYWDTTNPLMVMTTKGAVKRHRVQLNTDFTLEQKLDFLLEGLKFTARLAYDNNFNGESGVNERNPGGFDNVVYKRYLDNGDELFITPPGDNQFDFVLEPWGYDGLRMYDNQLERRLFYQLSLNYNRTFAEKHNLGVLALMNREKYAYGSMFPRYREDWVARVTYNFDNRYFLDVNGAYNGSEKFGPDYRFELFPSAAVGWMISNEPFMQSAGWLDMLKIRGSYGLVGDDNVAGRWGYVSQWNSGGSAYMNNSNPWAGRSPYSYYKEAVIGNPDLRWETSTKLDIGFELAVLNNMFTVDFDVFSEERNDIIVTGNGRSVPSFLGFKPPDLNVGRTQVRGYELAIGFNHYINPKLKVWSNVALTLAKDKILFREEPELKDPHMKTEGFPIDLPKRSINGEIMSNWDDVYASIPLSNDMQYRRPGYYNMLDFNSDGVHDGNTDSAPYGYPVRPQNTWNWSGGTDYHGFSLMVQFYGAYNATKNHSVWDFHKNTPLFFEHLDGYWTVDNPDSDIVLPSWKGGATTDGYRDYFDASYVRLKNVELAYNFSGKGDASYRVYINGNNLLLWSHLPDDRENNRSSGEARVRGDYPTFRRVNIGINVNF